MLEDEGTEGTDGAWGSGWWGVGGGRSTESGRAELDGRGARERGVCGVCGV